MRPCLTVRHGRHGGTPGPGPGGPSPSQGKPGRARACLFRFIFQLGVPVRASVPRLSRLGTPKARPRPAQVNHCFKYRSESRIKAYGRRIGVKLSEFGCSEGNVRTCENGIL